MLRKGTGQYFGRRVSVCCRRLSFTEKKKVHNFTDPELRSADTLFWCFFDATVFIDVQIM